jgi:hypothetical protein
MPQAGRVDPKESAKADSKRQKADLAAEERAQGEVGRPVDVVRRRARSGQEGGQPLTGLTSTSFATSMRYLTIPVASIRLLAAEPGQWRTRCRRTDSR